MNNPTRTTSRAGSSRRLLGGRQLSSLALVTDVERADNVRHLVVAFFGRPLTRDEEDVLQLECTTKLPNNVTDQAAAGAVVQSLMAAHFRIMQAADDNNSDNNNVNTPRASFHLEAEAVQVETMAVHKLQACARGVLCRKKSNNVSSQPPLPATKPKPQEGPSVSSMVLPGFRWVLSTASQRRASALGHALDSVELSIEMTAVVILQSVVRGFLVRSRTHPKHSQHAEEIVEMQNKIPTQEPDQQQKLQNQTEEPKQTKPILHPETPPRKQESLTLPAIPEKEASTPAVTEVASQKTMDQHAAKAQNIDRLGLRRNLLGMQYLNESQSQLSSLTSTVKQGILVKMQALVRGFLVRRRRRPLRKEKSIRAAESRRNIFAFLGTPHEQEAAKNIQRSLRGYVQRWKYWTAMRQQQLKGIMNLKAKQLRKIRERKKSVMKSCKKQICFDATSLARQLQRAKRAIKFLVKEEQRTLAQNDKLAGAIFDLAKTNKFLENSTDTATNSNEILEAEVTSLEARNQRLRETRKESQETLKHVTLDWKQANKQTQEEKSRSEQIESCIGKIKERAQVFLREHPLPAASKDDSSCTHSPQRQVKAS